MRKPKGYRFLLWMLPILAICLTACGDEERQLGIDGWLYTAEEISLPGRPGSITDFREKDGYLYYRQNNTIYRAPAEELYQKLPLGEAVLTVREGSLCDYTLDSEGGICYVMVNAAWTGEIQGGTLVRQQPDGKENCRLLLEEVDSYNVSLAMDGRNRAFLLAGDCLYVTDAEGNLTAEIPGGKLKAEFFRDSGCLMEGGEGSVYYSPSDFYNIVYEITGEDAAFRGENFQMNRIELPVSGTCHSSDHGLLCSASGMLYQYRKEDSRWETLLRYGDSNLPSKPKDVLQLSDECLAAFYSYPYDTFYAMNKTEASGLPGKEVLVLAAGNISNELEAYIMDFNRTDSRYHIRVEFWDSEQMDVRMASSNPPDLIKMEEDMVLKYAGKGALEDLSPWLEESPILDREDFLENVLEGYTIGGRLVCIPDCFTCQTVLGRSAQLGEKAGWTARDVMEFAESYPEASLFRNPTFTSMLSFFREYILERYIDWESGECGFDGEEFRELVMWMEAHSEGFGNGMAGSTYDSIVGVDTPVPEEELLVLEAYIYDLSSMVRYGMWIGEDINAVGYPTVDGRVSHSVYADNTLGIVTDSGEKEAAWQFLEGFLAGETEEKPDLTCLSTRRDFVDRSAEELVTPEYVRNEKGEVITWESTGEPGLAAKQWLYVLGESIPLYCLTGEQADQVLQMIEAIDFTPKGGVREKVLGILLEELAPYLEGKKSLEEAARIVQNRVGNLVQENL